MFGLNEEIISIKNSKARAEVADFLAGFGLGYDEDVDYTVVLRREGKVVATCSKAKNVLKCFAVSPELQGEGVSATLMTALINRLFDEGIHHYFIFTMPDKIKYFEQLGFRLLYRGLTAALMEGGLKSIDQTLEQIKDAIGTSENRSALVMNCNPFTLGHLYVIEQAAAASSEVLVFIVEEDKSVFKYVDRLEMVKRGTAHLNNVVVLPGTPYIISSATFPSYFLRQMDEKIDAFMELDAGIFCDYFCKVLDIKARYVGSEPYCNVTNAYNSALGRVFKDRQIALNVVERKLEAQEAISASRVRALIKDNDFEGVKALVPVTTFDYLTTTQGGMEAVKRIQTTNTPH